MLNKLYGYLMGAVAFVVIMAVSYLKGRSNATEEIHAKENVKKLEDIKVAKRIEHEVAKTPDSDIDAKLSKWMRD